jgi:hypothetical protein
MLDDQTINELRELIDARWDETLTDQQAARLKELVCRNDDACWFYLEYTGLHGLLSLQHSDDLLNDALLPVLAETTRGEPKSPESTDKPQSPVLGFLGDMFQAGTNVFGRSLVLSLLFAIGLPGVILTVLLIQIASQPAVEVAHKAKTPAVVENSTAKVIGTHGCRWEDANDAVAAGTSLSSGDRLRLAKGFVKVAFRDGAHVLLEGPVTFEVKSESRCSLHAGSLVANVSAGAEGFAVETPNATIVDLGTEFGVSVKGDEQAEAHVFQGEIEVAASPRRGHESPPPRRLFTGQAVEVRAGSSGKPTELVTIKAAPARFTRRLLDRLPKPTVVYAHHGDRDPRTEGWRLGKDRRSRRRVGPQVGPVNDRGARAWSLRTQDDTKTGYYDISYRRSFPPELLAEAKEKGWVMRGRVWVSPRAVNPNEDESGLFLLAYRDEKHVWKLYAKLDDKGNQCVVIHGNSSLGKNAVISIPGSRNRYVDYEMRGAPGTKEASVFINGQLVATGFWCPRIGNYCTVRFGMWRWATDIRFASAEWGILRDTGKPDPGHTPGGVGKKGERLDRQTKR